MTSWTPTLLLIVPMILEIALLYAWLHLKKRSNRKFPRKRRRRGLKYVPLHKHPRPLYAMADTSYLLLV